MFSNIALDVFIGLAFVFLIYSLLATIFQEFISQIFDLRAKMLQKGIARMLRDDNKDKKDDPEEALWKRFLYQVLFRDKRSIPRTQRV